jgi:hypothetical protein
VIRALPDARAATRAVGNLLPARAKDLDRPLSAVEKRATTIGVTRVRINGEWEEVVSVNANAPAEAVVKLGQAVERDEGIFRQADGEHPHPDAFLHREYAGVEGFEAIAISHAAGPCPPCRSYFTEHGFGDVYWDSTFIR